MTQRVTNRAVLQFMVEYLESEPAKFSDRQRLIQAEYLETLTPIERTCYARHQAGIEVQQIASELFLPVSSVRATLIEICVQLRMRIYPPLPDILIGAPNNITEITHDTQISRRTT